MKHFDIKKLLITVIVLLCSVSASAHDFEVAGIYYKIYDEVEKTVIVTFRGTSYNDYSNEYIGSVIIPKTVIYNNVTYRVTNISKQAFYGCSSLTSITIGNNVLSIGPNAFQNCNRLESVTIGKGVTSIGDYAFRGCSSLKSLYINNVEPPYLGDYCFTNSHYNYTSLYVPQGALATYKSTKQWKNFSFIKEFDFNEIFYISYFVDDVLFKTDSLKHGEEITLIEEPTKEGHAFSGWSEVPKTMPAENIIVTGSFTVNKYLLTYIVDNEIYASDSVAYGTAIEPLKEPTKEGHTFSGWSEIPKTMPAKDITIIGLYNYTITYIIDGEEYKIDTIAYSTLIKPIDIPTKENRRFSGWHDIPETMPAEDIVIEGSFLYNVIFMVDGKYYHRSEAYYGSNDIILPQDPQKTGYTFLEWSRLPEFMPAEDIILHAIYNINRYQLIFIIDGKIHETLYLDYGSIIKYPTIPGYIIEWNMDELPETMPAEDLIIIGTSIINTAIETVNELFKEKNVYTLDGHRILDVENIKHGIYIINGKKTVVK